MTAQDTARTLKTIVFPGGFNWPIFAADALGYFTEADLDIEVIPTRSSKQQMAGLIDGEYDLAMTGVDNVIAYNCGQGEAPTRNRSDVVAVMGADSGFLHLVARPGFTTTADLKGARIAVDALTTGYAFVLLRILEEAGIGREDVTFVEAGGVLARFEGLLEEQFDATLLISPFDAGAAAKGFNRLASGVDVLGAYQGVVAAARRDWAEQHADALQAYIAAWLRALDWLFHPENRDEAIGILRAQLPNMSAELAAKTYDILLDPQTGFYRDGHLNHDGIETAMDLRRAYGAPGAALGEVSDHIHEGYLAAARQAIDDRRTSRL